VLDESNDPAKFLNLTKVCHDKACPNGQRYPALRTPELICFNYLIIGRHDTAEDESVQDELAEDLGRV